MRTISMYTHPPFDAYQAVFDGDELLALWHGNDASWRDEYFNPLLAKLGIEVISLETLNAVQHAQIPPEWNDEDEEWNDEEEDEE